MRQPVHVLTGATGLLGAALALELATTTDSEIVCLVRPGQQPPGARLRTALAAAAEAYALAPELRERAVDRPLAVPADFTADACGVDARALPRAAEVEFWHLAGRLALPWRQRRQAFAGNLATTRRALALARAAGTTAFTYVSTAHVAGAAEGPVPERLVTAARPRNPYEAGKIAAERLVGRQLDFRVRILRPGLLIGHSTTLAHPGRGGALAAVQRALAAHARRHPAGPGAADGTTLHLLARPEAHLNLVPVDHVAREAAEIGRARGAGVFHLTNAAPPTTGEVLRALAANAGTTAAFVTGEEDLTEAERHLHRLLRAYVPYATTAQRFRRDRTDAVVADPARAAHPLGHDELRARFRPWARPCGR
ncbi:SDR family oxidoreductase [Streptomyces sp. NPDC049555]|uniref:SDR family oxidoreductase n=1 Tax=Streptomyces sp. NPDC049555 TaxID=3154930 RepID=UPI00342A2561